MKSIFFLFLLVSCFTGHCQNLNNSFWSVVHDVMYDDKSLVTDNLLFNDQIYVCGIINKGSCYSYRLIAYDFKGKKSWQTGGYFDKIVADKDYIYTAGYTPIDDVIGFEQIIINKYDKQGRKLFSTGYPDIPHDYYFKFPVKSIDVSSGGKIYVASEKSILETDTSGSEIKEIMPGFNFNIEGAFSIFQNYLLITSPNKIYIADSTLKLVDSVSITGKLIKVIIHNDSTYCLFENSLIRFNITLNNNTDTLISNSTVSFNNMQYYDSCFWIQYNTDENINLIKLKNNKVIDTLSFKKLSDVKNFVVRNNKFAFIGNSYSDQIAVYCFEKENLNYKLPDIQLVDFKIDSIKLEYVTNTIIRGFSFNAQVSVKNIGEDTVKSIAFHSLLTGGMNCARNIYYRKIENLEITSGQTINIYLKGIYEDATNTTICLECLAPNSMIETDTSGNSLCKKFNVDISGVFDKGIKVYPNPVYNILNIETDQIIKNVIITDISGKEILNHNTSKKVHTLNMSFLEKGIYIIRITTNEREFVQKIVKK